MELKNDFFGVKNVVQTATGFDYSIELNSDHFIYKAHFPDNPITPGVCIIQIVKELLEGTIKSKLFLKKIDNVKFLNVINPLENNVVTFSISFSPEEKHSHKINAIVYHGDKRFATLSMLFANQ
jgi:3-hydroxyacyl-[acyl-carrier-protein] dehydratase